MIAIALYSSVAEEIRSIRRLLTAYSIQHSWADCQVDAICGGRQLRELEKNVDILICDVSDPAAVEAVKVLRTKDPTMLVFPIAGPEVPPTCYVCPEIMPCGLFWRPLTQETAQPVVEQMMARIHGQSVPRAQNSFRISGKQKVQDVPFASILFFEAREKKLVLRMADRELMFSGTLSQLEVELPPQFIRCHKSFLVNRSHILSVDRTASVIVLDERIELPISRSYKKAFWEGYRDDT